MLTHQYKKIVCAAETNWVCANNDDIVCMIRLFTVHLDRELLSVLKSAMEMKIKKCQILGQVHSNRYWGISTCP